MSEPERRQHQRAVSPGRLRVRMAGGSLPMAVIDFGAGGMQCEGLTGFELEKTIAVEVFGPDERVVLRIDANPVYSRKVDNGTWHRTGFAFVGLRDPGVQEAVQSVLRALGMS